MKQRTLTSVAIVAVLMLLLIFSEYIFYPVALALLALIAACEIFKVIGAENRISITLPAYLFAIAFPIASYFVTSETILPLLLTVSASMFVYLMWLMGVAVFSRGKIAFSKVSEVFAAALYLTVAFTSMSLLRYTDRECGVFAVVLVFLVSWASDVFAFVCGSLFGKHKLIPEVSPKKTVEGSIGGVVFAAIACLLYGLVLDLIIEDMTVNYYVLAFCGAILSVLSQLGDLIASLIKREHGVKDYGKIFPGHGGVMDRFDSVLAVSTILLILCIVFPPFVIN